MRARARALGAHGGACPALAPANTWKADCPGQPINPSIPYSMAAIGQNMIGLLSDATLAASICSEGRNTNHRARIRIKPSGHLGCRFLTIPVLKYQLRVKP